MSGYTKYQKGEKVKMREKTGKNQKNHWLIKGCRAALALVLAGQMILGSQVSALAEGPDNAPAAGGDTGMVLDSAWEVENPTDGNLVVNQDGSVTITTEGGDVTNSMNNVLYYQVPNTNDMYLTVKVSGIMDQNYQAGQLIIASGKNLENAVGVMFRHHGYLAGNYGSSSLMGVMVRGGNPNEYYEAAEGIDENGGEFYLKIQKQNGRITGFYAKEYSDDPAAWNQIVDTTKNNIGEVDKGNALIDPANLYVAVAASSGGTEEATDITFSDLRVNGQPVAFATNPASLSSVSLSGNAEMEVGETQQLTLKGLDYNGGEITDFDSVTYTSSDEEVATVDGSGIVSGLANGTVTITAEATLGSVTKTASVQIQVGDIVAEESWTLKSPDGNTEMTVNLMTGGSLEYTAKQDGVTNIGTSPLGMVTSAGDFSKGLVFKNASDVKEINETYQVLSGKSDEYTDHCNEQTLTFTLKNDDTVEFDLVMRAYDDGTAYRYAIRTQQEGQEIQITDETSGLQLPGNAEIYWMNYESANFSYQSDYMAATTESLAAGSTPCLPFLYGKDGVWTLFSEADLNGTYTGSMLTVKENGLLDVSFCKTQGSTPVVTTTPFKSPWRAAVTGSPEDIVKNTMMENLSTPADYDTYDFESWVEPGMSSWSWVANWGGGASDQSKKETHLNWIDLAAEMGWKYYILDEGWNVGGRGNVSGMYDWWPEVRDYAEEKGVKLWVWVHVSDIDTQEERDRHFKEWSDEGIVGIKPDFFDGEDQAHMQLYDDLYRDAARYHLMVNCHGANKPTGEIRTWPNVYGREAISGQEEGGIDAWQYTIIPFARAAVGPAEVTEEIRSKDYSKTTMGFQFALTALVEDGIHSLGSAPEVYRSNPEGLSYYTDYPDGWDQTEFAGGEIAKYVSIARRAGTNWYVSGVSQDPRTMDVSLDYLDPDTEYTVLLYKENGREDVVMEILTNITSQDVLSVDVLQGGGYALRAIPEDEVDSIQSITVEPKTVTVEAGRYADPIKATLSPEDVEFKDIVWSSADETIATVDQNGVIRGVAAGETTVTVASAFDENVKAEVKVTVQPPKYVLNEDVWTILNPTDNVIIEDENTVTITTENGVLGSRNWENMFSMDVPDGDEDFTITAKISGGLNADYQGGFITVFDKENPDNPSLAVGRRHHGYLMGSHPQSFGVMSTQNGSTSEFYCEDTDFNSDVWVKVEKTGNTFLCSYSYDKETWTEITNKGTAQTVTNDQLAASENLCVGFYAGSGGGNTPIDIQISDFTYNGVNIPIAVENEIPTEPEVDKTSLEQAIAKAEGLNQSDYTADSWEKLMIQVQKGKEVLADPEADETDVADAVTAIEQAISDLEKVPTTPVDPEDPDGDKDPGDSGDKDPAGQNPSDGKETAVDTGDETNVWIPAGIMAAALACMITVIIRRRKRV